jgi:hypothetical protein
LLGDLERKNLFDCNLELGLVIYAMTIGKIGRTDSRDFNDKIELQGMRRPRKEGCHFFSEQKAGGM